MTKSTKEVSPSLIPSGRAGKVFLQRKAARDWNVLCPIGTPVILVDDFGHHHETTTRSPAWVAGGHALVLVEGRTGGYLLSQIWPMGESWST